MHYLLEWGNPLMNIEHCLWRQLLLDTHSPFSETNMQQLADNDLSNLPDEVIPLGGVSFTNMVLKKKYSIDQIYPCEVPLCLRHPHFLGRDYKIVPASFVPMQGEYFIKDASELKRFTYKGDVKHFDRTQLVHDHNYVISEIVNVLAEYRVYVSNHEIYAVEYYNGNPLVLPNIESIKQAVEVNHYNNNMPRSYVMDFMVTDEGTFVLEMQPVLFAVGLYTTVLGNDFLRVYRDSLDYVLKYNHPAVLS